MWTKDGDSRSAIYIAHTFAFRQHHGNICVHICIEPFVPPDTQHTTKSSFIPITMHIVMRHVQLLVRYANDTTQQRIRSAQHPYIHTHTPRDALKFVRHSTDIKMDSALRFAKQVEDSKSQRSRHADTALRRAAQWCVLHEQFVLQGDALLQLNAETEETKKQFASNANSALLCAHRSDVSREHAASQIDRVLRLNSMRASKVSNSRDRVLRLAERIAARNQQLSEQAAYNANRMVQRGEYGIEEAKLRDHLLLADGNIYVDY